MDLIKLLDVANPKKTKDTVNLLIQNYEDFGDRIQDIATKAAEDSATALSASQEALERVEENELVVAVSKQTSEEAKQIAEEALVIIEQADKRSEEATALAEQAIETAEGAVGTSELAMNVATEAKSTVDQAISTGVFGTFVYNPNNIALQRVYATDNVEQENTAEKEYLATPKLVRDAISDLASTTDLALLAEHKAFAILEDYSTSSFFEGYSIGGVDFWRCSKFNTLSVGDKILCFVTRYKTNEQMQLKGLFSCTVTKVDTPNRYYRVSSTFLKPMDSGPSPAHNPRRIALISDLPTDLADLSQDAEHRLVTDAEKTAWNNKLNSDAISDWAKQTEKPTYSYSEIINTPVIPTDNSQLTNGGNYLKFEAQTLTDTQKQQAQTNITHTATQNHATSGVQVGWYQVANLKTNGNYDIKIKQSYNYNLPEAIHLSISINNRLSTVEPFASITQLSGVNPGAFSLSKIRVRQGTDSDTTFLDVYNPDRLWNTTWVDITSDTRDVVVEPNSPFQFIGTEDNPSGYKVSSLDLVTGFNTSYLRANTATISGTVSDLNTISQPVNSVVTYSFSSGCANAPITDSGMVTQMQESTAFCTQLVIANDENASTWRRSYRDGTWTEWTKVGTFVPYEYNKAVSFGESGYLYIGKFPIYDTNITVDISSTTSTTYSGKLVIACQNYAVLKASVFGDYSNTVTPNIYYKKVDNTVEIYFKPQAWSKNVIHITGCGIQGEVTHVCEKISTIPSDATLQPENEYVESGQTGAGQTELIYDMDSTDASINHGYPNGLVGGRAVEFDYSKYKKLRIYAQATIGPQPYHSSTEFNIYGDVVDNTLTIADFSGTYVYFLHIRATKAQNRVALFYTMKITNNDGTVTAEKLYANETVVLTKIEGLY